MIRGIILLCVFSLCGSQMLLAADICYVGSDIKDKDNYFKKIATALENGCKKIELTSGRHRENFILDEGASLSGRGKDSTVIVGAVTLLDDTSMDNLTIREGGVAVSKDATVRLSKIKVSGARTGVDTKKGSGKIILNEVELTKNHKGIYLQAGNKTKIDRCNVHDNKEEGIDIRSNVSGSITNNSIINNEESGIELILGRADLVISGNKINRNHSSGIATQYYKGMGKIGKVAVKNNTINGNSQYGINCKTPSGGSPGSLFWGASLDMSANSFANNKLGDFADRCSFSELNKAGAGRSEVEQRAATEREAREKVEQERIKQENLTKAEREAKEEAKRREEQKRKKEEELQKRQIYIQEFNKLILELDVIAKQALQLEVKMKERSRVLHFLVGPNKKDLNSLIAQMEVYDEKVMGVMRKIAEPIGVEKESFNERLAVYEKDQTRILSYLEEEKHSFSLFGWIGN